MREFTRLSTITKGWLMSNKYEEVIREVCLQCSWAFTVQDILQTAVDECMLTEEVARTIAAEAGVEYKS